MVDCYYRKINDVRNDIENYIQMVLPRNYH